MIGFGLGIMLALVLILFAHTLGRLLIDGLGWWGRVSLFMLTFLLTFFYIKSSYAPDFMGALLLFAGLHFVAFLRHILPHRISFKIRWWGDMDIVDDVIVLAFCFSWILVMISLSSR